MLFRRNFVTDANGRITGTYRSGDVTQPATIRLETGESFTINQEWADKNDPNKWQHERSFTCETPAAIAFKPRLPGGTAITGHSMAFRLTKVAYRVWDEAQQEL